MAAVSVLYDGSEQPCSCCMYAQFLSFGKNAKGYKAWEGVCQTITLGISHKE